MRKNWRDCIKADGSFQLPTLTMGYEVFLRSDNGRTLSLGVGGGKIMRADLTQDAARDLAHALLSFASGLKE